MSPKTGKFICPDCRKSIGKSLTRDSSTCGACGKRICNYCHVAQSGNCRPCKAYGKADAKPQETRPVAATEKKKKKFLFF